MRRPVPPSAGQLAPTSRQGRWAVPWPSRPRGAGLGQLGAPPTTTGPAYYPSRPRPPHPTPPLPAGLLPAASRPRPGPERSPCSPRPPRPAASRPSREGGPKTRSAGVLLCRAGRQHWACSVAGAGFSVASRKLFALHRRPGAADPAAPPAPPPRPPHPVRPLAGAMSPRLSLSQPAGH